MNIVFLACSFYFRHLKAFVLISFPRIDIFSLFILAGVFQGVILSFVYLHKANNRYKSNVYIGVLFLVLTLIILEIFLNYSGLIFKVLWLDNFSEPGNFLMGPLMYLYVKASLKMEQKRVWPHFICFGLYCLYHILYLIQPLDFRFDSVNEVYAYNLPYRQVNIVCDPDPLLLRHYLNEIFGLHWLTYFVLSAYFLVKKYKAAGLKIYSMLSTEYTWVRNFIFHVGVSFILFITVKSTFGRDLGDYLVATYVAAIMYITTFYLIKTSIALKPLAENVEANASTVKYQKSSLKETDKEAIIAKLESLMKDEKVFKNNLLSLSELAKRAGVASHHLSQVINETTEKSFFEYLAAYRVEEAKNMLSDEKNNLTIEEIAEEVGYNSKSAFNKIFKKHTNLTPSEYREKSRK